MTNKNSSLLYSAAFNYVFLILLGGGIGICSLLLGASVYGLPMFISYFTSPLLIILNLLPPILLVVVFYFITGRAWLSYLLCAVPILLLSITGYLKMQIRAIPFIASDFALFSEALAVLPDYSITINWKLYTVAAAFIIGLLLSVFLLKRRVKSVSSRVAGSIVTALLSAVVGVGVYTNADLYDYVSGGFDVRPWASTEYYISKGFMYPFINSIQYAVHTKPQGFDRDEAVRIMEDYENTDIPDGKKVNFISIMLEAYTDLSRFGVLDFEIDVYEPLRRLQEDSVSGELVVNSFGGGTIDTERLFLTGFTKLTNYTSPTNSYLHYLRSQGYYIDGVHAGDSWFYDRNVTNKYLGFENYYFLEDYKYSSRQDSFFFPAVRSLYDTRDTEKPYFNYSLSYQNHGAYDSETSCEPYYIAKNDISDESFNILNNYLTGIYDTSQRLESFINSFRNDPEPVVIIVFGDHMPWLGNYESVYLELGVSIDMSTDEGFYNYYTTPYLIWANDAAKKATGGEFSGNGGTFSPSFLMGEVFRHCAIDGDAYMQALRQLKEFTDVINTPTGLLRKDGVLTPEPDDMLKRALDDFSKLEYYRLHNFYG